MKLSRFAFALMFVAVPIHGADKTEQSLQKKFEERFSRFLRRDLTMESLRWKPFPFRLRAERPRLWEAPEVLMAEAPCATMSFSMKTLFTGRLHVRQMFFRNVDGILRFDHSGHTNLTRMIADILSFAREHRRPGQRQKVVYHVFRVEDSRIDVVDVETNRRPLGPPLIVNGKGTIQGMGPKTRFPFKITAVFPDAAPARLAATGTLSHRPIAHIDAKRIPISTVAAYLPALKWFAGAVDGAFDFSKAGAYTFWKFRFETDTIHLSPPLPFPKLHADGFFHAFTPSHLNVTLAGEPTELNVTMNIKDFRTKRVSLSARSESADIEEIIRWCRTGFLMNEALASSTELNDLPTVPTLWQATGRAELKSELASIMGPRLVREAEGHIQLRIFDGTLVKMPGFLKALAQLNLSSLLLNKEGGEQGLKFKTIRADIDIKDGIAQTRDLVLLESPTLNLGFSGKINFVKQTIDARMLIGIVSVPEDLIARIPLVRRFTDADKKGVIPFWLAIQGRLDNPNITPLPLNKFDRALWKALPIPWQLPERELKKIYD